jgi:hypothetical protein
MFREGLCLSLCNLFRHAILACGEHGWYNPLVVKTEGHELFSNRAVCQTMKSAYFFSSTFCLLHSSAITRLGAKILVVRHAICDPGVVQNKPSKMLGFWKVT